MNILGALDKVPARLVLVMCGVLVVVLGFVDYVTGPDLSFLIFYLVPVIAGAWVGGGAGGVALAVASAAAWVIADGFAPSPYPHFAVPLWNLAVKFGIFCAIAYSVAALRMAYNRERVLNLRLEESVSQLKQLNEEMEEFNAAVSHDLRTPLIVISGFSRRLLEDLARPLDARAAETVAVIKETADRMSQLVTELLELSRSSRQPLRYDDLDMNEIVTSVIRGLAPVTPENLRINVKGLSPSRGDRLMIHQVFYNLLSNAIKFTRGRADGVIDIGCSDRGDSTLFYVKDNGAGFDMNGAGKLFRVFHRLHSEAEFQGTGVGLAIVKRIVNRHGGEVWGEGSPGSGATFSFTLPRR